MRPQEGVTCDSGKGAPGKQEAAVQGRLFTLVSSTDQDEIFAWGMEITHADGHAAVIYRWNPCTKQSTHGIHGSAEGARLLYSRAAGVPLLLLDAEGTEPALT
jgi:hypothetical protein